MEKLMKSSSPALKSLTKSPLDFLFDKNCLNSRKVTLAVLTLINISLIGLQNLEAGD